ncbi:MAG: hypothetical protein EOM37_04795 [Proteobacteria bacterium]|nr:hypothetical protein [Pseudomonadota bacterium]
MASIILSSIGSSVGNALVPGIGGRLLSALGRRAGRAIDREIGWSSSGDVKDGPRLENFQVQDSRYGIVIPTVFGRSRIAGNVIWTSGLIETAHENTVSGGKGGIGSSFSETRTTYSYSLNCAIAICAGEIGGIETIWADSKIIYQNGIWKDGVRAGSTVHLGGIDQAVDPLLQSWIGARLVPAYRGVAYIVIEGLELSNFSNRLPNLTFEVIPADEVSRPAMTGEVNPAQMRDTLATRYDETPPIVLDGSSSRARQILQLGYLTDGFSGVMTVAGYDVTGDAPVKLFEKQSDIFGCSDVGDQSWALAGDERFAAIGLQDAGSGKNYCMVLFDKMTRSFGPVTSVSMEISELRQIAWIDDFHFVLNDQRSGRRGVRVMMRAGMALIDCGFRDVWGLGSATTRFAVCNTQFRPFGEGLISYMGNAALKFSAYYARTLHWVKNDLVVGDEMVVTSGYNQGNGSGPQVFLLQTGEEEWTLLYLTTIDMQMMSFVPSASDITITRPWQKFTSANWSSCYGHAPMMFGNKIVILHRSNIEVAMRITEIGLGSAGFTMLTDAQLVEEITTSASIYGAARIDPERFIVLLHAGTSDDITRMITVRRRFSGVALDEVVGKILRRAGYQAGDYDVSALAGHVVDGYVLANHATAASALAPLQALYAFDLVESDGALKAVPYGSGDDVALLPEDCGAASEKVTGAQADVTRSRVQELDLPVELTVDFLDALREYEVGSQCARRKASRGAMAVAKVELPLVCTSAKAKQVAQEHLYRLWAEREQYRFFLSRKWMRIEPGDIVTYEGQALRVMQTSLKDGVIQMDALTLAHFATDGAVDAFGGDGQGGSLTAFVPSVLTLMDLPLLRNQDDEAGIYVAISGRDGWQGASLWRAADGVNFTRQTIVTSAAVSGIAVTELSAKPCEYLDRISKLRVQLLRGSLSSCSEAELLAGANAALCGAEIIQFQTATLIEEGLYELSDLLRGRKGTESACGTHDIGEAFVMLDQTGLQFLPASITDRGATYHFRAVSQGGSLGAAQDIPLTYQMKTLEPLAPCHLGAMRSNSDIVLSWKRRGRKNAAWVDYIDVPLDEAIESYIAEVWNNGQIVRSFEVLGASSVTYTAAMLTMDWGGSVPAMLDLRVCQLSDRYGRGAVAQALV